MCAPARKFGVALRVRSANLLLRSGGSAPERCALRLWNSGIAQPQAPCNPYRFTLRFRKMASNVDSIGLKEVLLNRLKCKICGNRARAGKYRWFRCAVKLNHQVCQDCKNSEKNLLRIDSSISKDYCEMTDELWKLKSMKFNCSNEKQGCEEILEEQAMISHEIDWFTDLSRVLVIAMESKYRFMNNLII